MIVCLCHRVTERDIVREAEGGCASFDELQQFLLVGTACGACRDCAHDTFHAAARSASCAGHAGMAAQVHRVAPPASRHAAPAHAISRQGAPTHAA